MIFYTKSTAHKLIECDVCHKTFDDILDKQEFLNIRFVGGYGSIFGDGNLVKCDICQSCMKDLLGDYLIVEER